MHALAMSAPPPGEPSAVPAAPRHAAPRTARAPAELTQPSDAQAPVDPTSGPVGAADPSATGGGGGCEGCEPDGTGHDPFATGGPAVDFTPPPVDPTPPPAEPKLIPQHMIEGSRISGDAQIALPAAVLSSLHAQGVRAFSVSAKLCVDEGGAPASVTFRQSSGYPDVDRAIDAGMRSWRYRPYVVDGQPIQACFVVVFKYKITE